MSLGLGLVKVVPDHEFDHWGALERPVPMQQALFVPELVTRRYLW